VTETTIFSDFTSPFCYLAEAALWPRVERGEITVRYRALELFPPPAALPAPADEHGWREAVAPLAAEQGVLLAMPAFRPRTGKAHEASAFAAEQGVESPFRRAVFEAYWRDERDIGRIDVLMSLGAAVGLDPVSLRIALDLDRHAAAVQRDAELARRLNVPGAPTLYIGTGPGARSLIGAHPASALDEALAAG
jgi:predicted DsbA family dithiol-disulfide isomerase